MGLTINRSTWNNNDAEGSQRRPRRSIPGNSPLITTQVIAGQGTFAVFPSPVIGVRTSAPLTLQVVPTDNAGDTTIVYDTWPVVGDGQLKLDCSFIAVRVDGSTGYNASTVRYYFEGA